MKAMLTITLATALLTAPAMAGVPLTFNIQGILADDDGIPLPDGDYLVDFALYDAATGGNDVSP